MMNERIISLGRFAYKGRLLTLGSFLFPALLIVFALVRSLPLALLVLVLTGWLAELAGAPFATISGAVAALVWLLTPEIRALA